MKKIIAFLLFSSTLCFALEPWLVVEREGKFFLSQQATGFTKIVEIESVGGIPQFLKEKKLNDDYTLLIYNAGEAGTSKIYKTHQAAIYNHHTHKNLGVYPYRYFQNNQELPALYQPVWKLEGNRLQIIDAPNSLDVTIEL
jgi:hypothetical protein